MAKSVERLPVRGRLLTGRAWLDTLLGHGLAWLLGAAFFRAADFVTTAYIRYVVYLPPHQEAVSANVPWAALCLATVAVCVGGYLALRPLFPRVAKGFGQTALWVAGFC